MTYFSKSNRLLLRVVVAAATMAPLLASCSDNEGNEPAPDYTAYRVAFTLNLADTGSRAAGDTNWGENTDPNDREDGTGIENEINWNDFHVAFYDATTNAYLGYVFGLSHTSQTENNGIYENDAYKVEGTLMLADPNMTLEQVKALNPKMMIVANATPTGGDPWDLQVLMSRQSSLEGYTFSWEDTRTTIPMWGVSTPGNEAFSKFAEAPTVNDLGEISLLRAVAKIEVQLSQELIDQGVTLTDATLSKRNALAYLLPDNAFGVAKTESIPFASTIRIPDKTATTENFVITALKPTDTSAPIISFYLPEYANATSKDLTLTVYYKNNDGVGSGEIYFRPYTTDGKPTADGDYDIVRNHIYRYTITGVGPTHNLYWTVCPMDEYVIDIPSFD